MFVSIKIFGQLPQETPLYPNGTIDHPITHPCSEVFVDSLVHPSSITGLNRVYSYVSEPTYMLFPANTEANKKIGLVIFPGGGLRNIWLDKEGTDIALWLSKQGITCMVVKYRTNRRDAKGKWEIDFGKYKEAVLQDARTSMLIMKEFADTLGFDKNKIGMIGFSAGGWLAEQFVYKYYNGHYDWNPTFVALIYHGNNVKKIKKIKDKENLPPFFMAIAQDDNKLPLKVVIPYLKAVSKEVKKSELHIYSNGGHGFGLGYDDQCPVSEWKNEFVRWADNLGQ